MQTVCTEAFVETCACNMPNLFTEHFVTFNVHVGNIIYTFSPLKTSNSSPQQQNSFPPSPKLEPFFLYYCPRGILAAWLWIFTAMELHSCAHRLLLHLATASLMWSSNVVSKMDVNCTTVNKSPEKNNSKQTTANHGNRITGTYTKSLNTSEKDILT